MEELAERLIKTIRRQELIKAGDRLSAAVSGGADSVALLLLLLELRIDLGIVLSVAHVNHQLRGPESEEDAQFVAELARQHGLELHARTAPLEQSASGIESAARTLRYEFFRQLMRDGVVSKIATAHTLDDQAETVLLRMLRGTGIRGLSGVHPRLRFDDSGEVVRPLLSFQRVELEAFLRDRGQSWREDSSNQSPVFLRNRVRHRLLPVIKEEFGPAAVEHLADLAEIARAEEEHWELEHPKVRALHCDSEQQAEPLYLGSLPKRSLAAQRRMIRAWLEKNVRDRAVSFRLIEEVRELACGPSGKKLELPGGEFLRRSERELRLDPPRNPRERADYEYRLAVPGQVDVPELGVRVEAILADRETVPNDEREGLLDPARMPAELVVRNWRPGDRFWPAHTKEPKKVKELLGDRHVTGCGKRLWPVAVAEGRGLVWMRGFAAPADFEPVRQALWIRVIER